MNKVFEKEEKPIKVGQQAAHAGSCFGLTLLTLGFGAPVVILWAITREYYQIKARITEAFVLQGKPAEPSYDVVMDNVDLWKRDLKFSYLGVAVAVAIAIPFDIWLF